MPQVMPCSRATYSPKRRPRPPSACAPMPHRRAFRWKRRLMAPRRRPRRSTPPGEEGADPSEGGINTNDLAGLSRRIQAQVYLLKTTTGVGGNYSQDPFASSQWVDITDLMELEVVQTPTSALPATTRPVRCRIRTWRAGQPAAGIAQTRRRLEEHLYGGARRGFDEPIDQLPRQLPAVGAEDQGEAGSGQVVRSQHRYVGRRRPPTPISSAPGASTTSTPKP